MKLKSIDYTTTITIALSPKEYFEWDKDQSINKKRMWQVFL